MHKYVFIILLFGSISSFSQSCNHTLYGTTTALDEETPLFGVTVTVTNSDSAIQTDFDGKFTLESLCKGSYTLTFAHPQYVTKQLTVTIPFESQLDIVLERKVESLNEITIEGKTTKNKLNTMQVQGVTTDELNRSRSGSLGDALSKLSGVSSLNTGNTVVKPMIHGLHSSRIVIMNNGVRMEDQEWGAEHAPNIDINAINSLQVIKGAAALQYSGNAVGGVIVADNLRIPIKDSLYGKTYFSAATNGRGTTTATELTKSFNSGLYAKVQGTLKRYGDYEAPDYVLSNTGSFEKNFSINLGFNKHTYGLDAYYAYFNNEIGILRASHLGGAEDLIRAINSDVPLIIEDFTYKIDAPRQDVTHQLIRFKGFKKFDRLGRLDVQYDFQRNNRLEFDVRRSSENTNASLDLELDTHTVLAHLESNISDRTKLKTGISAKYQTNFADPSTGVKRLIPDYDSYALGAYAIAIFKANSRWQFELGGRFDYLHIDAFKFYRKSFWDERNYGEIYPEFVVEEIGNQVLTNPVLSYYNPSITLGFNHKINDTYKVYFNYTLASRAPNPSELFSEGLHHSASRIELGDLQFDSEMGHKFSVAFERNQGAFQFSVNPFVHAISNFITLEPTGVQQTIRGSFQVWEYRQTNAQLLGVDFDATLDLPKNLQLQSQFSLVKGYDVTNNNPLINMPPVSTRNELVYNNPKYNNLRLALQSEYVFRQNEFPDTNFEVFIPDTQSYVLVDVSTPPDAYHLMHFNGSVDVKTTTNTLLTVGVGVTNLLNTSYRNYLNRLRYYADDLGRNFTLNLTLNY